MRAILLVMAFAAACTNQQKAQTGDGGTASSCAGLPPRTLDDIWTAYLTSSPSSSRGGCALSGCHLDGAGGMQFSSPTQFAAATINVPSTLTMNGTRVVPGDPDHSVVYQRLADAAGTGQMPPGGPYLTASDLDDIAGWICAGAPATSNIDGGVAGDGGVAADTTPPTFAGASSATAVPSAITVTWTAATDNVTPSSQIVYLVYQATSAGGESFAAPTYTTTPGATSFTIGKLPVSATYYFVVRAKDQAGNVDTNSKEVQATTPSTADTTPPTFAGVSAATALAYSVDLSWNAATDNVTPSAQIVYLVYQATTAGGESYATPTYTTSPGATSFSVSGLAINPKYYFVVRAEDLSGNIDTNTRELSATTSAVTLSGQVEPIFSTSCALSGCHTGARPAQGLDLSTAAKAYSNLVNVFSSECTTTKRVAPGSVSSSYLAWKLQGTGACFFGSQMPKTGGLTTTQINTIFDWISEGAPNN